MTLNEDYTFKAYWTTRPGTLDEREVSGKWDYYVYDDNVYRKLEFERDSFKNPHFTELYVDKDMRVYIYDIYNDEISQEQYFSSEQSVGRFKEKRKRKQWLENYIGVESDKFLISLVGTNANATRRLNEAIHQEDTQLEERGACQTAGKDRKHFLENHLIPDVDLSLSRGCREMSNNYATNWLIKW